MTTMRGRAAAGLAVALALAAGCGGGGGLAEVSGTVTVDGVPANGSIAFTPVDGKTGTSGGAIADGKYAFKAPPGAMKVEIRAPKVVGKKKLYDTPESPVQDVLDETLPDKYNNATELRFDVVAGQKNEKAWELSTAKGK